MGIISFEWKAYPSTVLEKLEFYQVLFLTATLKQIHLPDKEVGFCALGFYVAISLPLQQTFQTFVYLSKPVT